MKAWSTNLRIKATFLSQQGSFNHLNPFAKRMGGATWALEVKKAKPRRTKSSQRRDVEQIHHEHC